MRVKALVIAMGFAFSVAGTAQAGFFPPRKSNICISAYSQLASMAENSADETKYLLNSLRSFRENTLKVKEAQASVDTGFISSQVVSRGFSRSAASGRVAGIEEFMLAADAQGIDRARFMKTATVHGKENVELFLSELRTRIDEAQSAMNTPFNVIGNSAHTILTADLLNQFASGTDPILLAKAVAMNFTIYGTDSFITRPRLWDMSFFRNVDSAKAAMNDAAGGWALISRNFHVFSELQDLLKTAQSEEDILIVMGRHATRDETSMFLRSITGMLLPSHYKRNWVGLDLFFERTASGEPELHIVLRGSEKRPIFPKKETEKKSQTQGETRLGIIPGAAPVPK